VIRVEHLRKTYGTLVAVDDLSLEVEPGSVFGFLGRNGAGKTTTIRMMMGLLEPTAGTVALGGHDIRQAPEAAKAVTGYLPDHPFLYDKLTGLELLRFVGSLYGLRAADATQRAARLLEEFGLARMAGELTETLSHGMRQRLALAAALVHRPRVLVLDEPMVGLDPEGALELRRLLRRLAADGVTIFLSTHSLAVAEELCSRIGIIDRGRLVALGTLEELRARARGDGGPDPVSLEAVFLDIVSTSDGDETP
jgi:ABC-2 type transport system ATP-binding protein